MSDTLKGRRKRGAPPKKSMAPGGGGRFAVMVEDLEQEGNVRNPKAVAAAAGRKRWGGKKMAAWSAAGRKRAS